MEKIKILRTIYKGLFSLKEIIKIDKQKARNKGIKVWKKNYKKAVETLREQGACGETPKRDGSGKGIGNKEKKIENVIDKKEVKGKKKK